TGLDATAATNGHVRVVVAAGAGHPPAGGSGSQGAARPGGARPGGSLWFAVSDDGPGLTAEEREQLFVPGFTTKAHGSGLGLTIVERIVSEHGGTIEVDSAPGRGTTFIIQLPIRAEA